ncbi:hypothetical protein N7493_000455 [Penicillium malachiteum]|uniref:Uncharacterized protein n=1 Tax=Penicillium malachiteum TaxID=1324776 RepID=A0AAD6HWZ6_9EURO|nr:hypothetical protein N7493_000455 [Penicillium malachiteum]
MNGKNTIPPTIRQYLPSMSNIIINEQDIASRCAELSRTLLKEPPSPTAYHLVDTGIIRVVRPEVANGSCWLDRRRYKMHASDWKNYEDGRDSELWKDMGAFISVMCTERWWLDQEKGY